jgi:hypothetical protein
VSLSFPIIFAAFVLENDNFGQPPLLDDGGTNRDTLYKRAAYLKLFSVGEKEHFIEGNVFPDFAGYLFHFDYLPGMGFVLPPAGPENGIHGLKSSKLACG